MKIGYQLFSALDLCQSAEGLKDTIKKIAEMGYDGVEFFSYQGIPAAEMKALLAECGVEAVNSHVQLERWEKDAEGELAYAKELGLPFVTIPWMAPELRNAEGYAKIKELIVKLVPLCEQYGVKLVYHNHHFEFDKAADGRFVLDDILSADAACKAEVDTFWCHYADVDPAGYMEALGERLAMIHVKDYISFSGGGEAGGMEMPSFCAIGTGKMDNGPVLEKAKEMGLPWIVVEQDNSRIDVLESARISVDSLKKYYGK